MVKEVRVGREMLEARKWRKERPEILLMMTIGKEQSEWNFPPTNGENQNEERRVGINIQLMRVKMKKRMKKVRRKEKEKFTGEKKAKRKTKRRKRELIMNERLMRLKINRVTAKC